MRMIDHFVDKSAGETGDSSFNIRDWINRGLNWQSYIAACTKNIGRMKDIYARLTVPEDEIAFFRAKGPFTIICIAEDWCPDCVQNVPLLIKLAESLPLTRIKFYFRDRNEDLMKHYLTNGKKVIPTFIFFDRDFNQLGKWSGPSRKAKAWTLDTLIKGRKIEDIPQEEKVKFDKLYDERFLNEFFTDSLSEIRSALN